MADTLKSMFDRPMMSRLAELIRAAWPAFPVKRFLDRACKSFDALELTERGKQAARALAEVLPEDYPRAIEILIASLGPPLPDSGVAGFEPFKYLPIVYFIGDRGLDHFEASMEAQYHLTKRFTAEWSIRAFLEHHPQRTLARLELWAKDRDPHVRRLVSEGTRPRLPWAPRLRAFQKDPQPVLHLLELLRDDPSEYVRRSVANNLNDIGKDHPDVLVATARRWLEDAPPERRRLVEHALRSAIKRGEAGALDVLGHGATAKVEIVRARAEPRRVKIGDNVRLSIALASTAKKSQSLLVDLGVHFIKANGKASAKVFKLQRVELAPGETVELSKSISFKVHTTRRPFPGKHHFDLRVNGAILPAGDFTVV